MADLEAMTCPAEHARIVTLDYKEKNRDVVVIGGGPAGMMAAVQAAEAGASVLLLEKNEKLGKKLLITGGGRCNVTNAEFDNRKLLEKFKGSAKFLFSPFSQFSVKEAIDFFHARGVATRVEAEKRVFPTTDKAESVWQALVESLAKSKAEVSLISAVAGLLVENGQVAGVRLADGRVAKARSYVLATGGKSRPETGSTGEGFAWLKEIGHTVIDPDPALVPVRTKEEWAHGLSGLSLPSAKLTLLQNGAKQGLGKGKILFTHFGLSGPLVLNMSKDIRELLKYGAVEISLDLFPDFDPGALDKKLQELFREAQNKKFKNSLSGFLPPLLASAIIPLSGIDPEKFVNKVSREERLALGKILKALEMTPTGLLGADKAIVTSGGVALEEVDFKTMQSKLYPNLYLVGDVLNIDRPSGGYSLQLCWTTGYVAGQAAARS